MPLTGILLDEETRLTLDEVSRSCRIDTQTLIALVHEGALSPEGATPTEWRFTAGALTRLKRSLWLRRHMEINVAGVALALDLLDEIDRLQSRLRLLERRLNEERS